MCFFTQIHYTWFILVSLIRKSIGTVFLASINSKVNLFHTSLRKCNHKLFSITFSIIKQHKFQSWTASLFILTKLFSVHEHQLKAVTSQRFNRKKLLVCWFKWSIFRRRPLNLRTYCKTINFCWLIIDYGLNFVIDYSKRSKR